MSVSPAHFGEFLQRLGHTVRPAGGLWWYNTGRGVYTSFPFDRDVDATTLPLRDILGRDGLLARFGCPLEQGVASHRYVCDAPDFDFPHLRSRTRTQVRRGLEECRIVPVDFELLRRQAIPLNADTLQRQGRKIPANLESTWTRYYAAAAVTPGAEAWGAFVGDDLAAYLISFTIEDAANVLIVRSALQHLKKYPNNALLFQFMQHKIRSGEVRRVLYGYESIQQDLGSLDQFKAGMGFRAEVCGQRVEAAGWLKPVLRCCSTEPMSRLLRQISSGETSAKLQGILHWYQQQPALRPGQSSDQAVPRAA